MNVTLLKVDNIFSASFFGKHANLNETLIIYLENVESLENKMSMNGTINPRALITIVIVAAVLIMFGAMIFGQLSSAVNDMPFMDPADPAYDEDAASVVGSVQSNAWIGFSLMAIIILVIVAFTVIRLF